MAFPQVCARLSPFLFQKVMSVSLILVTKTKELEILLHLQVSRLAASFTDVVEDMRLFTRR